MKRTDDSSGRPTKFGRRGIVKATAGALSLSLSLGTAAATGCEPGGAAHGRVDRTSPKDVAEAYVATLDAGARAAANELIARDGGMEPWSPGEFEWVESFDLEFTRFRVVEGAERTVLGDIELTLGGTAGTVRYRFRRTDAGDWKFWRSVDGLRVQRGTAAAAAAEAYVEALDAGNRGAANELIAEDGELSAWSARSFGWIEPFDVELVEFDTVRWEDGSVTAGLTVRIADSTERLRYELRRVDSGGWKLWRSLTGLR